MSDFDLPTQVSDNNLPDSKPAASPSTTSTKPAQTVGGNFTDNDAHSRLIIFLHNFFTPISWLTSQSPALLPRKAFS